MDEARGRTAGLVAMSENIIRANHGQTKCCQVLARAYFLSTVPFKITMFDGTSALMLFSAVMITSKSL